MPHNLTKLHANKSLQRRRAAFTLLELLLSLALIVLATALIGSLMQIYARDFATRGDDVRREQLARAILTMIAEDIRSVVLEQPYDPSVLEQLLGASGGGGSGAAGSETPPTEGGGLIDSGMTEDAPLDDDLAASVTTSLPPGIYGSQYSLMVDVSRVPRPDEYLVQPASLLEGTLTDVPGDMKTVSYYLQTATNQGVTDQMASFADSPQPNSGYASGLVRRQLDRAITAYAEEMGDTDRLTRTGDLVAPEVIALEFAYFDGVEWLLEWDSSTQSLPWLVQITLAMQSASGSQLAQLEPGTPLSSITLEDRQAYGLQVYELVVAIPGAQLVAADALSQDQDAGMEAVGL